MKVEFHNRAKEVLALMATTGARIAYQPKANKKPRKFFIGEAKLGISSFNELWRCDLIRLETGDVQDMQIPATFVISDEGEKLVQDSTYIPQLISNYQIKHDFASWDEHPEEKQDLTAYFDQYWSKEYVLHHSNPRVSVTKDEAFKNILEQLQLGKTTLAEEEKYIPTADFAEVKQLWLEMTGVGVQDKALNEVIRSIPQQPQRQYATDDQLAALQRVANKLGLYDAADVIRNLMERK